MSNDIKTLADAQPGGRVRLGDAPERCRECRHTTFEEHPDGHICVHCKLIVAAQPSPGGQGDALAMIQRYDDACIAFTLSVTDERCDDTKRRELRRAVTAARNEVVFALAARQPVASNQVVEDIEQLAVDTQPVVREPVCGTCRGEIRPDSLTGTTCDCAQRYVAENPAGYAECPVAGLPFYGNMEHPKRGLIAMYGGPLDVYSVPELQDKDGELRRERYDLDADCWVEGGEPLGYFYREQQPDDARQPVGEPVAIPEGWALVDLAEYTVLPQIPTTAMMDAGWPIGEQITDQFDVKGAYADLIAEHEAKGEGIIHGPIQVPAQAVDLGQTFQAGVAEWMGQCFLPSLYCNMTERGDRLLEEVLELLQAHGYDKARVPTLVDYVFSRPVGDPAQEVGGVMVTLAGYCWVAGLDMHVHGHAELARISHPEVMARIRAKQEAKNALHFDTPLPGNAAAPAPAQAVDLGRWSQRHADDLHVAVHTALSVHAGSLSQKKRAAISAYVKRLLIDSQAVGK
ncbi:hypothetical protein [Stenotrophomonas maltophilia group sp. Smal35]|uniref:hypothetical protein n=1 Tax=Stenotrophomonas maltophilia group sp. Smal35 TaxID=3377163 RepID=UPI002553EC8E|nr:hypothetical protein [Stenotrophomonas maltophilia]